MPKTKQKQTNVMSTLHIIAAYAEICPPNDTTNIWHITEQICYCIVNIADTANMLNEI